MDRDYRAMKEIVDSSRDLVHFRHQCQSVISQSIATSEARRASRLFLIILHLIGYRVEDRYRIMAAARTIPNFDRNPEELGWFEAEKLKLDIEFAVSAHLGHLCVPVSFMRGLCGYMSSPRFRYNCHKIYCIRHRQERWALSCTIGGVCEVDDDETETDADSGSQYEVTF